MRDSLVIIAICYLEVYLVVSQCPFGGGNPSLEDFEDDGHDIHERQADEYQGFDNYLDTGRTSSNLDSCFITSCNPFDRYRSYNGSCNNLAHPCWGKRLNTHNRLLPPDYGNGINSFREAIPGTQPLPNARLVSRTVHRHKPIDTNARSHLYVGWGQFIDHDFTNTALASRRDNSRCNGIYIPSGDEFFESPGCMTYFPSQEVLCGEQNLPRGVTCGCTPCLRGQAQQINTETSFIDASSIYGLTEESARALRIPGTAYLQLDNYNLPPRSNETVPYECESRDCMDKRCFQMGEMLNNQNVFLVCLQTMFIREHNRIVREMSPYIEEVETLYQEVRRIVGAIMQNLVYNEQLPVVLGECRSPEITLPSSRQYSYDASLNPQTLIECITSACRYGHTEMQGFVHLFQRPVYESVLLTNMFSMDLFCRNDSLELILGGCIDQRSRQFDHYFSYEATNKMSTPFWETFVDIASYDLERGRDHGIPTYTAMRQYCGLSVPTTYEEMLELIPAEVVDQFRTLYGENGINNIDLMSASVSEYRDPNCSAAVGPTYACIITEHYRRLKRGDRFWFENQGFRSSFTQNQIQEIYKNTIAGLMCRNTELQEVQENVLLMPGPNNLIRSCVEIEAATNMNLSVFRVN